MIRAVRRRPWAVTLGAAALALLGARGLVAQDTTRTDTARSRQDTTPARRDTVRIRPDSSRVLRPDTPPARPAPPDTAHRQLAEVRTPPPVPPPWAFGLELGFTDFSGNRDLQVFDGRFTEEHKRTTDYVSIASIEIHYGKSNGTAAVENSGIHWRFNHRPHAATSPFVALDMISDMIQKVDARVTTGAGVTFNVAPREDRHTTFSLGIAQVTERRFEHVVPNHVSDTRFLVQFSTQQPVSATAQFGADANLQPGVSRLSDYFLASDAWLKVTITRVLGLRTRYEWKRDTTPAPGVLKKDDTSFTVSLVLSW